VLSISYLSRRITISFLSGSCTRVPRVANYDPSLPVPSSCKWLGNQAPCTRYGPTTPSWRGVTTNLKRTKPRNNPYRDSHRQTEFYHMSAHCRSSMWPNSERTQASRSHARGLFNTGKDRWSRVLGRQKHWMPGTIGHGRRHPRAPGNKHLSADICPITTSHSRSTTGTWIIAMIPLTLDKHFLVKVDFSIRDSVH
jgi:hypothetical protein